MTNRRWILTGVIMALAVGGALVWQRTHGPVATVTPVSGTVVASADKVELALPVSAWRGARIRRVAVLVAGRTLEADIPETAADTLRRGEAWTQPLQEPGATLTLGPRGLTVTLPLAMLGQTPGAATLVLSPIPLDPEALALLTADALPAEVPASEPCTVVVMRAGLDAAVPRLLPRP